MTKHKAPDGTKYELDYSDRIRVWMDRGPIAAWSTIIPGTIGYTMAVMAAAIFIASFFWWFLAGLPLVWAAAMLTACRNCDDLHMRFFHQETLTTYMGANIREEYLEHPIYAEMVGDLASELKRTGEIDDDWWRQTVADANQKMKQLELARKETVKTLRTNNYKDTLQEEIDLVKQFKIDGSAK